MATLGIRNLNMFSIFRRIVYIKTKLKSSDDNILKDTFLRWKHQYHPFQWTFP